MIKRIMGRSKTKKVPPALPLPKSPPASFNHPNNSFIPNSDSDPGFIPGTNNPILHAPSPLSTTPLITHAQLSALKKSCYALGELICLEETRKEIERREMEMVEVKLEREREKRIKLEIEEEMDRKEKVVDEELEEVRRKAKDLGAMGILEEDEQLRMMREARLKRKNAREGIFEDDREEEESENRMKGRNCYSN